MSRTRLIAAAVVSIVGGLGLSSALAVPTLRVDINSDNLLEQANGYNAGYSPTEPAGNTAADPAFEPWFINGGVEPGPDEFTPGFDPRLNSFVYTGNAATSFVSKARITVTAGPAVERIDSVRRFGLPNPETALFYFGDLYRDQIQVTHNDTSVYSTLTTTIENNAAAAGAPLLLPNTAYNVTFFVYDKFFESGGNSGTNATGTTNDPNQGNTTMHFTDITSGGLGMQSDTYIFNRNGVKNGGGSLDFGSSAPTPLNNYTWATTLTVFTDGNGVLNVREQTPDAIAGGIIRGSAAQGGNKQISPLVNGFQIDETVNAAVAGGGAWANPATWADGVVPSNSTALQSQAANFFNNAGGTASLATATSVSYLNFAGTGSYTIAGNGNPLILDSNKGPNASVSIASRSGSHTIDANVRVDNRLFATINTGSTVTVTGDITFGSNLYGSQQTDSFGTAQPTMLFKGGNGTLVLKQAPFSQVTVSAGTLRTTGGVSKVNSLTFGMNAGVPTARLDLTGGAWAVDYAGASPAAAIDALITLGRSGGFTGLGITSSKAAADSRYTIGSAEASALNVTSVPGFPSVPVDADTFLFRLTLLGDANLTGTVDFQDLVILAQNYNLSGRTFIQGDTNYSGTVDFQDLVALAQNYNLSAVGDSLVAIGDAGDFTADWALAQSLVPEPTSLAAFGLAAVAGVRRRR